jgi:hypothetical protein
LDANLSQTATPQWRAQLKHRRGERHVRHLEHRRDRHVRHLQHRRRRQERHLA